MGDKQGRAVPREGALSIVASDLKIVGELHSDGVVKVDGVVEGNVRADRQVLVSKGGEVKGDIRSQEVVIGGRVIGSVYVGGRVEIQSTAVVHGDIATPRILVHEGGEVNGCVHMGDRSDLGEEKPAGIGRGSDATPPQRAVATAR